MWSESVMTPIFVEVLSTNCSILVLGIEKEQCFVSLISLLLCFDYSRLLVLSVLQRFQLSQADNGLIAMTYRCADKLWYLSHLSSSPQEAWTVFRPRQALRHPQLPCQSVAHPQPECQWNIQ